MGVKGFVEKATLRGGINSRPYEEQLFTTHRAGFILKGFTLKGI
jgi:hypothetical protein